MAQNRVNTVEVHMHTQDSICAGDAITLTCPDSIQHKDVLTYQWVQMNGKDSIVIGRERSVTVSPTKRTTYHLNVEFNESENNLVVKGDFEGIEDFTPPNYKKDDYPFVTDYRRVGYTGSTTLWDEGVLKIADNPSIYHAHFYSIGDHTSGKGNMMIVNGHPKSNFRVWQQKIDHIKPGVKYAFSAYGMTVSNGAQPAFQFSISKDSSTYEVIGGMYEQYFPLYGSWMLMFKVWTPPADWGTEAYITLIDNQTARSGNDFVIDDISFAPVKQMSGEIVVNVIPRFAVGTLREQTVCEGSDLDVTPKVYGDIKSYSWKKEGETGEISNTKDLHLSNIKPGQAGIYICSLEGNVCGNGEGRFRLTVKEKLDSLPELKDLTVCKGSIAEFTVATDRTDLTYEWTGPDKSRNWTGQYKQTYSKKAVEGRDVGVYKVSIKDECGWRMLQARLDTFPDVKIKHVPNGQEFCPGDNIVIIGESNSPTFSKTYWTQQNPVDLTGKVWPGDTLIVEPKDVGSVTGGYCYHVENKNCPQEEQAIVKVWLADTLQSLKVSGGGEYCIGENVTLSSSVKGGGMTPVYEWRGPDSTILSRKATASVNSLTKDQEGEYTLTVTDNCGIRLTRTLTITVKEEFGTPVISGDVKVCMGVQGMLEVQGGVPGLVYEWTTPAGKKIPASSVTIDRVLSQDTGVYVCQITSACGRSKELSARVSVYPDITVTEPAPFEKCVGDRVEFTVTVGANEHYTWMRNGQQVGKADEPYIIENIQPEDVGKYQCVVTSPCASKTLNYELKVNEITQITGQSEDLYVTEGTNVPQLSVSAVGSNLHYNWEKTGVGAVGASNTNFLSIGIVDKSSAGEYKCTVRGDCGTAEATIHLYVGDYSQLGADRNVDWCIGSNYSYTDTLRPVGCTDEASLNYRWTGPKGEEVSKTKALVVNNVTAEDEGIYTCVITAKCGTDTLRLTARVLERPVLSLAASQDTLCEGDAVKITASVNNIGEHAFDWQHKGGGNLSSTINEYSIDNIAMGDAGVYVCIVRSFCGEATKEVELVVRRGLRILHQTDSLFLCKGANAALEVVATGDSLTYAWAGPAGGEWEGSHDAVYHNDSITHAAAGQYHCVVNSSCGTDTLHMSVDIEKDLELMYRTPNQTQCMGTKLDLEAQVNLDHVKTVWTLPDKSTREIERLPISVAANSAGNYIFYIQSPKGCSDLTDSLAIRMHNLPGKLFVSGDTAVCEGETAHFKASMSGVKVTYYWMGPNGFTKESAEFEISDVTADKTGPYVVRAKDFCENDSVATSVLSLRNDFKDITVSADTAVCLGSDVKFAIKGGIPGMTYTWSFGGKVIGHDAVLWLDNVQDTIAGKYVCTISSRCGVEERSVNLSVLKPLELSVVGESEKSVCVDETVEFEVEATGENITYEWIKEGESYVRTTDSKLILTEVDSKESGKYRCEVSSTCGTQQLPFELNVKPSTVILGHSPNRYVSMGDSVHLFVFAAGLNNRYEWDREGIVVSHDSIVDIPDVGYDIYDYPYQVKVAGDCGADSVQIMVRVGEYIEVPFSKEADTICEGSNYTYVARLVPYGCLGGEPVVYTWKKKQPGGTFIEIKQDSSALFKIIEAVRADTGNYICEMKYFGCPIDGLDPTIHRDTTFKLRLDMIGVPVIASISPKDTSVVEGFNHSIQVVASGEAIAYRWEKNGTALHGEEREQIDFMPVSLSDAATYKVTVENICSHVSASSRLRVYEKTVITSPFEQWINACRYSDTILRVEAVGSNLMYSWFANGKLRAANSQAFYKVQNITKDADYMCVVSGKGGNDTCWFYLRSLDLPEVSIEGEENICLSPLSYLQEYVGVSPEPDLFWKWECMGGTLQSSDERQNVDLLWNGTGEGKIMVTVSSAATGCMNKAEKSIHYLDLPEVRLDLPSKVGYCIDSLSLTKAWPAGGYFIAGLDTVTCVKFFEKKKDYEVTYYYSDITTKCVGEAAHTIGVDIEPAIRLARRKDTTGVCRNLNLVVASVTPGRIVWSGSGLNLDTTDRMNAVFMPVIEDAENVYYKAEVTDSYGCKAKDDERILIAYPPTVKAMKDTVVGNCDEGAVIDLNLSAEYITSYFDRFRWLPADKAEIQADYTAKVVELKGGKNNFVAEVVDVFGCVGQDSVTVILMTGPQIADQEICLGDTLHVNNAGYTDFQWSDGYDREQRSIYLVGTDTLWVTDGFGCKGKAVYTVRPLPQTNLADTFLLRGQQLKLPLELDPLYAPYDIVWQDGSGVQTYIVGHEGEYWVKVMDNIGCTAIDTARITFIEGIHAPDAFLPESSGENSRFYLKEINFVDRFEMYIYNRWGELIFKTREIGFNGGWDGTYKGKKCGVGTYVWVAFNNGKRLGRGTVTLIE